MGDKERERTSFFKNLRQIDLFDQNIMDTTKLLTENIYLFLIDSNIDFVYGINNQYPQKLIKNASTISQVLSKLSWKGII